MNLWTLTSKRNGCPSPKCPLDHTNNIFFVSHPDPHRFLGAWRVKFIIRVSSLLKPQTIIVADMFQWVVTPVFGWSHQFLGGHKVPPAFHLASPNNAHYSWGRRAGLMASLQQHCSNCSSTSRRHSQQHGHHQQKEDNRQVIQCSLTTQFISWPSKTLLFCLHTAQILFPFQGRGVLGTFSFLAHAICNDTPLVRTPPTCQPPHPTPHHASCLYLVK